MWHSPNSSRFSLILKRARPCTIVHGYLRSCQDYQDTVGFGNVWESWKISNNCCSGFLRHLPPRGFSFLAITAKSCSPGGVANPWTSDRCDLANLTTLSVRNISASSKGGGVGHLKKMKNMTPRPAARVAASAILKKWRTWRHSKQWEWRRRQFWKTEVEKTNITFKTRSGKTAKAAARHDRHDGQAKGSNENVQPQWPFPATSSNYSSW